MRTDKKYIFGGILLFFLLSFTVGAYALEVDYPSLPGAPALGEGSTLSDLVDYIIRASVTFAGMLALIFLVIGGIRYMTSTGDPVKMTSARDQISSATIGLLILLSSFLVLQTINPQLVEISDPEVSTIEPFEVPETSPMPTGQFRSSISAEIPLGKILDEYLLETKYTMSDENRRNKKESRMDRIRNIGTNSLTLANKIEENSKKLKDASEKCSCGQARAYCEVPDPTIPEKNNLCISKEGCTGDPCTNSRNSIQEIEKDNLKIMFLGKKIKQKDGEGNEKEIETSLRDEQEKATEEIRLIKKEIGKIEIAESFMIQCPLGSLDTIADFLDLSTAYRDREWILEVTKFWPDVITGDDWITFYCPVSGTEWEEKISSASKTFSLTQASEAETQKIIPCTKEIPVGEIIDRAKRVGYKLVERLEKIIKLNEELIGAAKDLHTSISQCSSQGPSTNPNRSGCFSVCQETVLGVCIKSCQGNPCPDGQISNNIDTIKDIVKGKPDKLAENEEKKEKEGIRDVVEGKRKEKEESREDPERREQVGINTIIDDVVPSLILSIDLAVRQPLKQCVSGDRSKTDAFNCSNAKNGVGPDGKLILDCCYSESWYQDCLSQCYLETDEKKYKECLGQCQGKAAKKFKEPAISRCFNAVNFYCCTFE